MKKRWKIKSREINLKENGMFYRPGEKVRIKTRSQLFDSGLSESDVIRMSSISGKIFLITRKDEYDLYYRLLGSDIAVTDADIAGKVIG
jgi:hypothetical protein